VHVIWKRPDGFHDARPVDFEVLSIADNCQLWLHKIDFDWYPFQISGGWADEDSTKKLNNLINRCRYSQSKWMVELHRDFDNSIQGDLDKYLRSTHDWLNKLLGCTRGDRWERELIAVAIRELIKRLKFTSPESC